MDISKASNFERYVFDLVGRDPAVVRALWRRHRHRRRLRSRRHAALRRACAASGFVSGTSTHADRLATIRDVARALRRRRRSAHRRRHQGRAASIATPACRWSASRPRCRPSSRRRSARRSAATRSVPPRTPTSSRGRSAVTRLPADADARQGVHRRARLGRHAGRAPRPQSTPHHAHRRCATNSPSSPATSRAGLRLALFVPVTRLAFRIDVVAAAAAVRAVGARSTSAPTGSATAPTRYFSWFGAGNELFAAGLMLLSVARCSRSLPAARADRSRSRCWRWRRYPIAAARADDARGAASAGARSACRRGCRSSTLVAGVGRGRARALRRRRARAGAPVSRGRARSPAGCCSRRRSGSRRCCCRREPWWRQPCDPRRHRPALSEPGVRGGARRAAGPARRRAGRARGRAARRDRPLFRRLRRRRARGRVPQGRAGGAARDGRALGHRRALDRAHQQSAHAARHADRHGDATCARR